MNLVNAFGNWVLRVWPSGDAGDGRGGFCLRDGRRAHRARDLSCGSSSFGANGGVRLVFTTRRLTIDGARMWQLVRLGTPAALQLALEVGVFAAAAALAGRISPVALAANQVVLTVASFFFMVPFGLSSAAAVRVGQAVGRDDPEAATTRGLVRARSRHRVRRRVRGALSVDSGSVPPVVHDRSDGARGRQHRDAGMRAVSTVRRISSGGDGRAAWTR